MKDPVAALSAARGGGRSRRRSRAGRSGRRLRRARARGAARACRTSCGSRSGRASCAPTPPRSRRWRWSAASWGTGGRVNGPRCRRKRPNTLRTSHLSVWPSTIRRNGAEPCYIAARNQTTRAMTNAATMSERRARFPGAGAGRRPTARGYARVAPADPAGGAVPRPVGRRYPQAHVPHHRPARPGAVPAARFHHRGVARLSRLGRAGRPAGFAISARCSARATTAPANSCRRASNSFGRTDTAAADAEMLSLGLEATAEYGVNAPEIRMGDVGLFTALVDGLDLAPAWKRRLIKDFNRAGRLERDLDVLAVRPAARARIPRRAVGDGRLRTQGGACAGHRPAVDRRHQRRRRPLGRRDRRPISRAGRARRAASLPHEIRALIQRFLGSAATRTRPRPNCAPSRPMPRSSSMRRSTCSRAAPGFWPRAASTFRGSVSRPVLPGSTTTPASNSDCTIRGRLEAPLVAGGRYDKLLSRLGSATPIPAVGFAAWIERLAACRSAP